MVDFEVIKATVNFEVVMLEFSDANPHVSEGGFQRIQTVGESGGGNRQGWQRMV